MCRKKSTVHYLLTLFSHNKMSELSKLNAFEDEKLTLYHTIPPFNSPEK